MTTRSRRPRHRRGALSRPDETTGETRRFALDHTEGLRPHYSAGERFDSDVERTLAQKWERANMEWKFVCRTTLRDLKALLGSFGSLLAMV